VLAALAARHGEETSGCLPAVKRAALAEGE
jgi:hypothetical protein